MARNDEKPAFSKRQLNMAEGCQAVLSRMNKLGSPIVQWFAGSSSPSYVQAQWRKQQHISPAEIPTITVPGDPTAGRLPRNWHHAAVFAVDAAIYDETRADSPEIKPAVAYVSAGKVRVGFLPNGTEFGMSDDGAERLMASRLGSGALTYAMGLWLPSEKHIMVPPLRLVTSQVPIDRLSEQFPGTPLA